jgi:serine/threonine protein kinase
LSSFKPQTFGKYFLIDKIATGGMAEIFKAKTYSHGGFENLLVIKRILSHLGENKDFIEMFIDEAKISVALQHPNIIRVYDFGKILDNYFIAMECVDGKDARELLKQLARQRRLMPQRFAIFVAIEVCKGLEYAHTKADLHNKSYEIVHRDISPSNVIISYEGTIKVADFGIAKAESNMYETRDGVLKGKYEYMSPEQAAGGALDRRSDIFSLGILVHEMLTGHRLFKTNNDMATLKLIQSVGVNPPSRRNPKVSPQLDAIVMKALSKKPADRYQSAGELSNALRALLGAELIESCQPAMARFMQTVFEAEILEERRRLEEGSTIAEQLRDELPIDNWEGHTDSRITTMSSLVPQASARVWPWLLAGSVLLIFSAMAMAVVVVIYGQLSQFEAENRPGSLAIDVSPAAAILIDGRLRSEAEAFTLDEVNPGVHVIRLELDGYEPWQESITLEPGERLQIQRVLAKEEVLQPEVAASSITFTSTPDGAEVTVDGQPVGETPVTWLEAEPGRSYKVVYRKKGHVASTENVTAVEAGKSRDFFMTMRRPAAAPGTLKIGLVGGGWAEVYVDGKQQKKTAPVSIQLSSGIHEVKVVNSGLGIDHTERVTIVAGRVTSVQIQSQ